MSRFGSDPLDFFNSVYRDIPPWEIGAPQPAMSALIGRHPPISPILDLGCGSGDLSIYLAQHGYEVVGIDFVETAIANAKEKAGALSPQVARRLKFQVADALQPSLLQQKFGSVVDSGFFHLFDPEECDHLIVQLAEILFPGGQYYMHEFDIDFAMSSMPRQITTQEIRARFMPDRGWRIKELGSAEFLSRVAPPVPAICACIERLPE